MRKAVVVLMASAAMLASCSYKSSSDREIAQEQPSVDRSATTTSHGSASISQGIFDRNCAGCHGTGMTGGHGPSLVDDVWIHGKDAASIVRVIGDGVMAKGMPAFKAILSSAEIQGLATLIRQKGASSKTATTPFPTTVQSSETERYRVEIVTKDIKTPWSIVFLSRDQMLVTERPGRMRVVHTDGRVGPSIAGVPKITDEFTHGGMLGLALAPDFGKTGWIYLAFTDERPDRFGEIARCGGRTTCADTATQLKVIRGKLRGDRFADRQVIWQADPRSYRVSSSFGGRMMFGRDGMLYFSVGDRIYGTMEAQDLTSPNGKIHRVAPDGTVPKHNPFVKTPGAVPSIWTYGNRNPQGLAIDPRTGIFWSTEHGPRGGDELNIIRGGQNYGWPFVTLGKGYDGQPFDPAYPLGHSQKVLTLPKIARPNAARMVGPVHHWTPSIAVSAIAFYTGTSFPRWRNSLFVTSLMQQQLVRLTIEGSLVKHEESLFRWHGRLRDVVTGPDGALYLAVNEPDMIVRLVPAGSR